MTHRICALTYSATPPLAPGWDGARHYVWPGPEDHDYTAEDLATRPIAWSIGGSVKSDSASANLRVAPAGQYRCRDPTLRTLRSSGNPRGEAAWLAAPDFSACLGP